MLYSYSSGKIQNAGRGAFFFLSFSRKDGISLGERGKSWNSTVMFAVIGDPNGFAGCFGEVRASSGGHDFSPRGAPNVSLC